jgi:putative addiction module component (TIGR02574 family)
MSKIDIAAIRRLSVDERIQLLRQILDSLAEDSDSAPFAEVWRLEIQRRLEAYRRDPSRVIPAEDALAQLEREFG